MLMVGHPSFIKTGNGIGSNSGSIQDIMLVDKLERKWKCAVEMIAKAAEVAVAIALWGVCFPGQGNCTGAMM